MNRERYSLFFKYVIPSLLSFALSGVYAIVDGLFVGNSIGDTGLSAINIAYPMVSLLQALGTGLGMGGAVLYSVCDGEGHKDRAENFARASIGLLLRVSAVTTALLYVFAKPLLIFLGARGELVPMGLEYLRIIILGGTLQIFATGVVPITRNLGGASFSMITMVGGFALNIALDWFFVWVLEMGMFGAGLATIIGQGLTALLGLAYILVKAPSLLRLSVSASISGAGRICRVGLAPFGLTLCPIVSMAMMNKAAIINGGENALACYACVAYSLTIVYTLLQGVGDGCQPLMSRCYGEGDEEGLRFYTGLAHICAAGISLICMAVLWLLRDRLGYIFGTSAHVNLMVGACMPIFIAGLVFLGYTRVVTSALYATEKSLQSYILVYSEPLFRLVLLLSLPILLGTDGVWWSESLGIILCAALGFALSRSNISNKKVKKPQ